MCKRDTQFYALNKTGFFVVPAELTDRINNLVHITQVHTVHQLVQFMEIIFDLGIVQAVAFAVSFVQHGKYRISGIETWQNIRDDSFLHITELVYVELRLYSCLTF